MHGSVLYTEFWLGYYLLSLLVICLLRYYMHGFIAMAYSQVWLWVLLNHQVMGLLLKRRMLIEESDLALKLRLDGREGKDFRLFF